METVRFSDLKVGFTYKVLPKSLVYKGAPVDVFRVLDKTDSEVSAVNEHTQDKIFIHTFVIDRYAIIQVPSKPTKEWLEASGVPGLRLSDNAVCKDCTKENLWHCGIDKFIGEPSHITENYSAKTFNGYRWVLHYKAIHQHIERCRSWLEENRMNYRIVGVNGLPERGTKVIQCDSNGRPIDIISYGDTAYRCALPIEVTPKPYNKPTDKWMEDNLPAYELTGEFKKPEVGEVFLTAPTNRSVGYKVYSFKQKVFLDDSIYGDLRYIIRLKEAEDSEDDDWDEDPVEDYLDNLVDAFNAVINNQEPKEEPVDDYASVGRTIVSNGMTVQLFPLKATKEDTTPHFMVNGKLQFVFPNTTLHIDGKYAFYKFLGWVYKKDGKLKDIMPEADGPFMITYEGLRRAIEVAYVRLEPTE